MGKRNSTNSTVANHPRIYDGEGDPLMQNTEGFDRIIVVPDTTARQPTGARRLRIMWGQNLVDDILAGRYRSVVCSVNPIDNSRGVISQIAAMLPTSQWDERSITQHAQRFGEMGVVSVIKYDMDAVEVLALLRPGKTDTLRLNDLALGFKLVTEMIRSKPQRMPAATVSFLGARANKLRDEQDREPTFETVLRTMHDSGFVGDVYPAPWMWQSAPIGMFARYPFPSALDEMREGGH